MISLVCVCMCVYIYIYMYVCMIPNGILIYIRTKIFCFNQFGMEFKTRFCLNLFIFVISKRKGDFWCGLIDLTPWNSEYNNLLHVPLGS